MPALVLQWAAPTNTASMQAQRSAIYERRNAGSNSSLYRWRPVRESFREQRFLLSNRKRGPRSPEDSGGRTIFDLAARFQQRGAGAS